MRLLLSLLFLGCFSCSNSDTPTTSADDEIINSSLYFPPVNSSEWATSSIAEEGWNEAASEDLLAYLAAKNTEAFIILKDGKIVIEAYMNGATAADTQPWNSAGKTLIAFTVGVAKTEGYLSLDDATSQYLGAGWTSMTPSQENAIRLKNQLTMTSGGDYEVANTSCYDPECLEYLDNPGSFWYYHNAFYTLLQPVLDEAVPGNFQSYYAEKIKNKIGMNGAWISLGYHTVYFSTARSMARFGLLNLNEGVWNDMSLIDSDYFTKMTNTSQDENKAYGYLWWLNGKESYQLPQSTTTFSGKLIPNAPDDLIAGLGKDDQKLYVVPNERLVIVRMGGAAGNEFPAPSDFDNELWEKLNAVIN